MTSHQLAQPAPGEAAEVAADITDGPLYAIGRGVDSFLNWLTGRDGGGLDISWLRLLLDALPWIIGAIALGILTTIAVREWRGRQQANRTDGLHPVTTKTTSQWTSQAEAFERAGQFREAVRAWVRAAVTAAMATDEIELTSDMTLAEIISQATSTEPGLTAAQSVFEPVWYGGRQATASDAAAARDAYRAVTAATPVAAR